MYCEVNHISFDTLEEAIDYANANGCKVVSEYIEYEKCSFCGIWFESTDLNQHGECYRCARTIREHGG